MMMTIGIIGSDDRALAIARLLSHGGHRVSFSDPSRPQHAQHAAEAFGDGATATTPYQQAGTCDALVLAVRWQEIEKTLVGLGDYKDGLLIDATRAPRLKGGMSGAEFLSHRLDNHHVVKAFVDAPAGNGVVKLCAADPDARRAVTTLIEESGARVEDLGNLSHAVDLEREYAERPGIETEGLAPS
jgi:predicted dinucleotide-binding enzyme